METLLRPSEARELLTSRWVKVTRQDDGTSQSFGPYDGPAEAKAARLNISKRAAQATFHDGIIRKVVIVRRAA